MPPDSVEMVTGANVAVVLSLSGEFSVYVIPVMFVQLVPPLVEYRIVPEVLGF